MEDSKKPHDEESIHQNPKEERIKRITPEQKEQEKKNILNGLKHLQQSSYSDENLDRYNEKFDLSQYRKHNPKALFIRDEPRPWKLKFPIKYYLLICKLKGWPERYAYDRPGVVGRWTNIFIYKRFPLGILQILQQKNEADANGNRLYRHHQFMTESGDLELEKFLDEVMRWMEKSPSWAEFKRIFAKEMGLPYQKSIFDAE
jgi:hypothetical protein